MCDCNSTCETCKPTGYICVPRGDAVLLVFSVREDSCSGAYFDIDGSTEIIFVVADSMGGTVRITKKLSTGGVAISTNLYQFSIAITSADTDGLLQNTNYYECRITGSDGSNRTVSSGIFKSPDTMIRDIP